MTNNSHIEVSDVSLSFRLYHDKSASLKGWFANLTRKNKQTSYSDFWALQGVDLRIQHGERVGIIGRNGAGKSTLLKTICRIYAPTSGHIQVHGRIAPLIEIGAGFNPELSGRDNIMLNGAILGYSRKFLLSIEEEIVAFTEMADFMDTPVKYYSSGMQQKLAFAIATAVHTDILIMDEVFSVGDAAFIEKAHARIRRLIDNASIMLLVSHDMHHIEKFCNRVILLDHGKLIADGNPSEILALYEARTAEASSGQ